MFDKYMHPQNRSVPPKGGKNQGNMCGGMKNSGNYPMPAMNRVEGKEKTIKGPEHYKKA